MTSFTDECEKTPLSGTTEGVIAPEIIVHEDAPTETAEFPAEEEPTVTEPVELPVEAPIEEENVPAETVESGESGLIAEFANELAAEDADTSADY